mmetsp:Transcript_35870/g.101547  ORF Transcript_35870/g.101547 Transcript_35870/m.101547 type:complete len:235 (-) Transcript_35870:651-1355(-)
MFAASPACSSSGTASPAAAKICGGMWVWRTAAGEFTRVPRGALASCSAGTSRMRRLESLLMPFVRTPVATLLTERFTPCSLGTSPSFQSTPLSPSLIRELSASSSAAAAFLARFAFRALPFLDFAYTLRRIIQYCPHWCSVHRGPGPWVDTSTVATCFSAPTSRMMCSTEICLDGTTGSLRPNRSRQPGPLLTTVGTLRFPRANHLAFTDSGLRTCTVSPAYPSNASIAWRCRR